MMIPVVLRDGGHIGWVPTPIISGPFEVGRTLRFIEEHGIEFRSVAPAPNHPVATCSFGIASAVIQRRKEGREEWLCLVVDEPDQLKKVRGWRRRSNRDEVA